MVQVQQQCSVYFCIKLIFESWFFWLIWPFECPISMILTLTEYHENLVRHSPLSLLLTVKFFSSAETKMILKTPNETFLRITRYLISFFLKDNANAKPNDSFRYLQYNKTLGSINRFGYWKDLTLTVSSCSSGTSSSWIFRSLSFVLVMLAKNGIYWQSIYIFAFF